MSGAKSILHFFAVTGLGGAELGALAYMRRQLEFEHRIMFLEGRGPAVDYYADAGYPTTCLDLETSGWLRAGRALGNALRRHPADVVHAYGLRPSLLTRVHPRRPALVQAIHSVDTHRPAWQAAVDRLTAGRVDRYIANSQIGADFVVRRRHVEASRTAVVPNGIDVDAYVRHRQARDATRAELDVGDTTQMILTVANLRPPKALDVLVESARHLAAGDRDFVWLVAGTGPEETWLRASIQRAELASHVRLLGFRRDVGRLLAASDVFCLTSRREGVPVAILEAMAVGRPVVATAVGGVGELVVDGETGRLVATSDPDAIHDALITILDDSDLASKMGAAGAERARLHFGVERAARELAMHYAELIAARAQR